jgi:hypothetical protein
MSAQQPEQERDAFISYNKVDEGWVRTLAERIERETLDGAPTGQKLTVFFAPWDIEYGQNFVNCLNEGLRRARIFLPVMSPEFFSSGWTNFEWTDQIALDPKNANGRIVPLFYRDVSLNGQLRISFPAPFGVLNRLDFRDSADFEPSFVELVRILRGWPKHRGSRGPVTVLRPQAAGISAAAHEYSLPSAIPEMLISNLLQVESFPDQIWHGTTKARKQSDVRKIVNTNEAFLLRDERLFAFCNVADPRCSLYGVIDPKSVGRPACRDDWMKDEEGRHRYVELLNRCLSQHLFERKIGRDEKGRFYFWPAVDASGERLTRKFTLGDGKQREVAARKLNPQDGTYFWVHYAARIRFELLDSSFFILIEPTYIFTSDGRQSLDGKTAGKLSIQWSGKQQNPDVLRAVLFWARVLADGKSRVQIPAGADFICANSLPVTASANFGVGGDYIRVQSLLQQPEVTLDEIVGEVVEIENCDDEAHEVEEEDA